MKTKNIKLGLLLLLCISGSEVLASLEQGVQFGSWIREGQFKFRAQEIPKQNEFLQSPDEKNTGMNGNSRPAMLEYLQKFEQNPVYRTISETQAKVMSLGETIAGGRWFLPILSARKQEKPEQSDNSNSQEDAFAGRNSGSKGESQSERYLVGYRLGSDSNSSGKNWVLGFGFKRGSSQSMKKDQGRTDQNQQNIASSANDSDEEKSRRQDFSGPIIGITGEF